VPGRIGVFTNTPLVHTLAATGSAPLTFSVTGLPAGVMLDAATGRFSGTPTTAGSYPLVVTVSNAMGSAERTITLVVGDTVALTPPMGWNSYDSFDDDVREAEFLAQAEVVSEDLLAFGWDTVVVDFRWYDPNTPGSDQGGNNPGLSIDANGRFTPPSNKFPSAAGGVGFKSIADQVHAMGLKFGIHIMRGIPRLAVNGDLPIANSTYTATDAVRASSDNGYTCVWNSDNYGVRGDTPAGQAWYDSIFALYASWGIDFVKVDDMTKNRPANQIEYHRTEVEAIVNAIKKSGRSIVFSLSPGETPLSAADHVKVWGNMWRMSDDFWDRPGDLDHIFDLSNSWQVVMDTPGHWPDADILPLGRLGPRCPVDGANRGTRFTVNEQVTMLTLWSLLPSPLMLGANLVNTTDAFTHALLTNEEVLAVSQDALGERARRIALGGSREAWIKDLSDGGYAVGLFNRGQSDQAVSVTFGEIGISGRFVARQAWQRQDQGVLDSTVSAMVPNRGAVLVVLAPETPPDPTGGAGGMGGAAGASGAAGAAGSTDVGGAGAGADAGAGGMSGGSAAGGNASGGAGDPSGGAGDPSGGGPSAGAGQGGAGASGGAPAGSGGVAAGGAPLAGQGGSASPAGGSPARSREEPAGSGCSLPGTQRTRAPWAVVVALAAARFRRRRAHGSPETSTR
jgi:hypothetical protein